METTQNTTLQTPAVTPTLPPVSDLLKQAWDLLTIQFGRILLLWLYNVLIYLAAFVVFTLLVVVFLIGIFAKAAPGFSIATLPQHLTELLAPQFLIPAGLLFIAFTVTLVILGLMYSAAMVLLLQDGKKEKSPWQHYKNSYVYVKPLFLTGLVAGFFLVGSLFFFFIPYIVVVVLLSSYMYVVILEKKQGIAALQMSCAIVWQNFWKIVLRCLMLWLAFLVVSGIIGGLFASHKEGESAAGFLQFAVNIFLNIYSLTYMYTLYRQARASYVEKPFNLTWIWVVASLGWLILILAGFVGFQAMAQQRERNIENNQKYEQQWQEFNDSIKDEEKNYMELDLDDAPPAVPSLPLNI